MLTHISRTGFIRLLFLLMLLAVCLGVLAIYFGSTQIVKKGNAKFETIDWMQQGVEDASRGLLGFVFTGDIDDKNTFYQALTNITSFKQRYQLLGNSEAEEMAINELTILFDEYFDLGRNIIAQKEAILELQFEYENSVIPFASMPSITEPEVPSDIVSVPAGDSAEQVADLTTVDTDMLDIQIKERYIATVIRDFERDSEKIEVVLQERLRASALELVGWQRVYINISVYLIGIIMVVGSFFGIWNINIIRSSLLRLRNVAEKMVQGDLKVRADAIKKDEVGQVASMLNLLADKLVEEMNLRHVVANLIPDPFMVLDKNEKIIEVNEIILDTTGYSKEELVGKESSIILQNMQIRSPSSSEGNTADKIGEAGSLALENKQT
jgi:methyl-accepting chemotaxis protein